MEKKETNAEMPRYDVVEKITNHIGPNPSVIRTMSFYPDSDKGFLEMAKEARDHYRNRLLDQEQGSWTEELPNSGIRTGDNDQIEIELHLRIAGEDWLLFKPNSEVPIESTFEFEFEILQEEQSNRNEAISLTDEDYDRFSELVEVWQMIGFYYLVFQGKWSSRKTRIEKMFVHHDLRRSRQKAFQYYEEKMADTAEGHSVTDDGYGCTVALVGKNNPDQAFFIGSNMKEMQDHLDFGCRQERKIFLSLGYLPPS